MKVQASQTVAGRLHAALRHLKHDSVNNSNVAAFVAWRRYLGMESQPDHRVLQVIGQYSYLPDTIKSQMLELFPDGNDRYLPWHGKVRAMLYIRNYDRPLQETMNGIDVNMIALIDICHDQLSRSRFIEAATDEQRVRQLLHDAIELLREVRSSDLPEAMKSFLIRHLDIIISGIFDYQVMGREGLEHSVAGLLGTATMSRDKAAGAGKSELGSRLLMLIGTFLILAEAESHVERLASKIWDVKTLALPSQADSSTRGEK
jgi:hypothetical protein